MLACNITIELDSEGEDAVTDAAAIVETVNKIREALPARCAPDITALLDAVEAAADNAAEKASDPDA